jgi:uncharacterized protein YdiU (UPF0061 family)
LFNTSLATELGLARGGLNDGDLAEIFSGNRLIEGMEPLAQAYAGHQFGSFAQLGDGRAVLLGEVVNPAGERYDIALKGSGRTPFSRNGDGRAALGPMLREYIVSQAIAALGIPTTRSLAVVTTGEDVYRPEPLPGAILTRVAASHIRVGTFEYFLAKGDIGSLNILADYVIQRHYPAALLAAEPYLALFEQVLKRQAELVARWMLIGFIHGVLNTDNVSIPGETIDYGPCAFIDEYHPETVFSSIDDQGRYRFSRQPHITQWNLARFGETLLPLLGNDSSSLERARVALEDTLGSFNTLYFDFWSQGMARKLGLSLASEADNRDVAQLIEDWLVLLVHFRADFTNSHRGLVDYAQAILRQDPLPLAGLRPAERALFAQPAFAAFLGDWAGLLARQGRGPEAVQEMSQSNPVYIPRNHRIEAVIRQAEDEGRFDLLQQLLQALEKPFQLSIPEYRDPPLPEERVKATFCGT